MSVLTLSLSPDRTMTGGTCPDPSLTRCTGTLGTWSSLTGTILLSTPGPWTPGLGLAIVPALPPWDEKIASLQICILGMCLLLETCLLETSLPAWIYHPGTFRQGTSPAGTFRPGTCLLETCLLGTCRHVISCRLEISGVHCLLGTWVVRCCLLVRSPEFRLGTVMETYQRQVSRSETLMVEQMVLT